MKLSLAIVLPLFAATAFADEAAPPVKMPPWRVKIDSLADGEFLGWPKHPCSPDVADHVRRVVLKHPYVEVIDGKMAARIDEKLPVPAQRQVLGKTFTAYYDVTDTRTIVFTIRWQNAQAGKDGRDGTVPVEIAIIARDDPNGACRETWLGYGKRI